MEDTAARRLAEAGMDVLLLEEHSEIGRPFQCAGLVNPTSMVKVDLRETILQDVAGARIHGPTNTMVPVGVDEVIRTHVVCRKRFDEAVVLQGMNAGAELWLRTRPTDMALDSEGVTIDLNREGFHEQIRARLVIGADGAHSWVRRTMKLGRPKELMIGFQAEVTGYQGRTGWLDMYLGSDYAPGFFAGHPEWPWYPPNRPMVARTISMVDPSNPPTMLSWTIRSMLGASRTSRRSHDSVAPFPLVSSVGRMRSV